MVNQPTITRLAADADGDRGYRLEWYVGDYYFAIELETDRKPYLHVMDLENSIIWNLDCNHDTVVDDRVVAEMTRVFRTNNMGGVVGGTENQIRAVLNAFIKHLES